MDTRVELAVAHWGPRFVTNGVTLSDFERITSSIDVWDDWCSAWCSAAEEHEQLGTAALADGRRRSAGVHLAQAAVYYHFAKFMFVHDIPAMRAAHERAVTCLTAALPFLDPPGRRIEVPFEGATLVGVLRTPAGGGPHPAVLMISGLDSAKEELRSTEQLFLDRGLATFSVDGPGQGEVEYALPIRPDWEVPGGALLDALCALPEIDEDRIGVWGVSLGGYYSPRVASGDARVRACIALAGPWNFGAGWDGDVEREGAVGDLPAGRDPAGGDVVRRLGPGQRLAAPVLALPDERLVVGPLLRPAVETHTRDVQPATDEPRRPFGSAREVDDRVPRPGELEPEVRDDRGPEALRLVDGDPVQRVVVGGAERPAEAGHVRLLHELRARASGVVVAVHGGEPSAASTEQC